MDRTDHPPAWGVDTMSDRVVPRYEARGILVACEPRTVDAPSQISILFTSPQQLVPAADYDILDAERQ